MTMGTKDVCSPVKATTFSANNSNDPFNCAILNK